MEVAGVLTIVYGIVLIILDRMVFKTIYFGNVGQQMLTEFFKALFVGFILSIITISFWWIAVIVILIAGLIIAFTKAKRPAQRAGFFGIFVVLAIVVGIVGYNAKKDITGDDKKQTSCVEQIMESDDYRLF